MKRYATLFCVLCFAHSLSAAGRAESGFLPAPGAPVHVSPVSGDVDRALIVPTGGAPPTGRPVRSVEVVVFGADGDLAGVEVWRSVHHRPGLITEVVRRLRDQPPLPGIPDNVAWDGTFGGSTRGDPVPDGRYAYQLLVTDSAGVIAVTPPIPVVVDRVPPPITRGESSDADATVSSRASPPAITPSRTAISPGERDESGSVTFTTTDARIDGAVAHQLLGSPLDDPTRTIVLVQGEGPPPTELRFAGYSAGGQPLNDGTYSIIASVRYDDGEVAVSDPVLVTIDSVPPFGVLRGETADGRLPSRPVVAFGGSDRPSIAISATLSEPAEWLAVVSIGRDELRVPIEAFGVSGTEFVVDWDGRDLAGRPLPDGEYTIGLEGVDAAGNRGVTNRISVVRDTRAAAASLSADADAFAPVAASLRRSVRFHADATPLELVESFDLTIRTVDDTAVWSHSGAELPVSIEWDGSTGGAMVVTDGEYRAELVVRFAHGETITAGSGIITVDRRPVAIPELSAPYQLVRPDDDGYRDTVHIRQLAAPGSWTGRITDATGAVVLEHRWNDLPEVFEWDGRDASGRVVRDGAYTYSLATVSPAGVVSARELTLIVDATSLPRHRRPPEAELHLAPSLFTPDGDGVDDLVRIEPRVTSVSGVSVWTLSVVDLDGTRLRSWNGDGQPPAAVDWDGFTDDAVLVRGSRDYRVVLSVTDRNGNRRATETPVTVGALVLREDGLPRIMVPDVRFAAGSADLDAAGAEVFARNREVLLTVAELLQRYPDRNVLIRGHSARDIDGEPYELSRQRAAAVQSALRLLGVGNHRMRTIGIGGELPLVPHSDRENAWANRRVDFILE